MSHDLESLFGLRGKVAAITGGGGVLCGELSLALGALGVKVAVLDLLPDAAGKVADRIKKAGGTAIPVECNVLKRDSVETACERILAEFGGVDILINGAGGNRKEATTGPDMSFFDLPDDVMQAGLPNGEFVVAKTAEEALEKARRQFNQPNLQPSDLKQDEDVMDTWFSSWLWPISVFDGIRFPDNKEINYYYPTNDLVTGPDIIFFWVARMIIAGQEFRGEIPFSNVYFTSIIRDGQGRKMSKSLGNSPDPLDLIAKYGADTLRYGIMLMAPKGQDILFSEDRLEVARNFMNKVWNASRFVLMNLDFELTADDLNPDKWNNLELADRWILHRLNETVKRFNEQLEKFGFNDAARTLWDFIWSQFCDWYIEIIKIRMYDGSVEQKHQALTVAIYVLRTIMKLLHPYAPFISEEIWQQVKLAGEPDLIVADFPRYTERFVSHDVDKMEFIQQVITAVRTIRSEMNVPPSKAISIIARPVNAAQSGRLEQVADYLKKLARVGELTLNAKATKPKGSATAVVEKMELFIPLEGLIDVDKEA